MEAVDGGKCGQLNPALELVAGRRAIESADVETPIIETGQGQAGAQADLLVHILPTAADVSGPWRNIAVAPSETGRVNRNGRFPSSVTLLYMASLCWMA